MTDKKRILALLLLGGTLLLSGCGKNTEPISQTNFLFDTVVTITLYGDTDANHQLLNDCFTIGSDYEKLLSRTIETSEISQINAAGGTPVTVSPDTLELLNKGLEYCELSGGKFDITIAPASSLWDFDSEEKVLPDEEQLKEAVTHVDYHIVHIEGNDVWLDDPEGAIDLGAIAKGFIADKMKDYLQEQGIRSGVINLGGNILTIGTKPDGSEYNIGIQYPFDQSKILCSVHSKDSSIVSSGTYQRYMEVDGKFYHHILDPKTGYGFDNNLLSVTILSPKSVDGDGLSTTCFALGLDEGMKLIESLPDVEAIFVTSDYELHPTAEDIILK